MYDSSGLINFVGSGRFGDAGAYPATGDGGPAARYGAGSFGFRNPAGTSHVQIDTVRTTATGTQGGFSPLYVVDGVNDPAQGWAGQTGIGTGGTPSLAAFFPTVKPLPAGDGLQFTFTLDHQTNWPDHNLGLFRVSVTDDPIPGQASRWVVLDPQNAATSGGGATLTVRPDSSLVAGGTNANSGRYTFDANLVGLDKVTGFRLEALECRGSVCPRTGRAERATAIGCWAVSAWRPGNSCPAAWATPPWN